MPKKIRILFAIGEISGGGSQRQLIGILQRLDRTRFEPQLYLVSPGGELLPEVPADVPVHIFAERCNQRRWLFPGMAHRARVHDLASVLREQQIDLIYDRTYHMTLIAAGATNVRPTPRISVIATDPQRDFETNRERFRSIKRHLLRRAYHSADRVVAVSEGVRQAALDYYRLPPEKTLTLYNFFDIDRVDRLMSEPLPHNEVRADADRFEIVAAGRLHPQKGFQFLLEAIYDLAKNRALNQIHLRILGAGPLQATLQSYVNNHGINEHVTLAGFHSNPLPYFRQADLFCLSSLYEGLPNSLVEAMLCRVPVLATDCPSGPAEVLDRGQLGHLVPPANSAALANAIADAIDNPQTWRSLVEPARQHIEQTFSPAAGVQKLHELLHTVAAQSDLPKIR